MAVHVVRTAEVPWATAIDKGQFQQRRKQLGGDRLSAGLWELPPGKRSFPLHVHHVTEEALFVVSGRGQVRTPEGTTPIGPGDWVSFPPGGPAHQLVNDGAEPLVYLGLGAGIGADLVEYPESDKVAATAGPRTTGKRFVFRRADQADYWEGEKDAG